MTTTTLAAVVGKIVEVIEGLTPVDTPLKNQGFAESKAPNGYLKPWVLREGGKEALRLFEVETDGDIENAWPVQDVAGSAVKVPLVVRIVYPVDPKRYGYEQRRQLEEVVATDAWQIRNALQRPSALVNAGHLKNKVTAVRKLDRAHEQFWFQEIPVETQFFIAQQ